jgi:hypothetical protein
VAQAGAEALRQRVLGRVQRSARAGCAFFTVRSQPGWRLDNGRRWRLLYEATPGRALRAGEPRRVRLLDLAAGTHGSVEIGPGEMRCEWLVVSGVARVGGVELGRHDYHVLFTQRPALELSTKTGARLYLREVPEVKVTEPAALTVRAAGARWSDFAPGLSRRVLWQRGTEAAMLYQTQPGAAVPRHGHGHDEECLMLEGEIFLDDVLLRGGEYQLAPAGTLHDGVSTDTGGMLYAHGDIELALMPL